MLNKRWMLLLPGLMLGSLIAADAAKPVALSPEARQLDVGRQEVLQRGETLVRSGNERMLNGDYRSAIQDYLRAVNAVENHQGGSRFRDLIRYCRAQIAVCYNAMADEAVRKADDLVTVQDFDAAVKICKEALEYCPEQRAKLEARIQLYEKRRDAARERDEVSTETLMPALASQQYQIQLLMEQGLQLATKGELLLAKRKYEEILLLDPYNSDALNNLRGINVRIGAAGKIRTNDNIRKMLSEVEWKYAIPLQPEASSASVENQLMEPQLKEKDDDSPLAKKLSEIIIPNINFEEGMVTLSQALDTIRDASRRADTKDKTGVNIILLPYSNASAQPQETAAAEGGNTEGGGEGGEAQPAAPAAPAAQTGEGGEGGEVQEPTVVLNVKNYSLLQILQELEKSARIKFRVDRNAVVIAPPGVPLDNMVTKFFAAEVDSDTTDEQLKELLQGSKVYFPRGSTIFFDRNLSRVVATNTPDNLKLIEAALPQLFENQQEMVQVMFKFIEVSQNDLDELAFNWQLSLHQNSDKGNITINANKDNSLLRYYVPDAATAEGMRQDANYTYMWSDSRGNSLTASLFALNWADSSDVLLSPRITTLAGQTAKVQMYTKKYYPEDYETEDYESTEQYRITSVIPQPNLDDEQDTGIGFIITPEIVDRDARLIEVKVNIPIKLFESYMKYDSRVVSGSSDKGEYIQKPIFNSRNITTDVTVKDGETVVLGGVSFDTTESVLDKIPILGDIPFVGRFFQSRYTSSKKQNLLIFMTCRMVKPDGSAKYEAQKRNFGLPEFSRNQ